jgi:hypothetical protein
VIESIPGGFQAFNVTVMDLIREWIAASAREMVVVSDESSSKDGSDGGVDQNIT